MNSLTGTGILWTTLLALVFNLFLATIIGRGLCSTFPWRLRFHAKFYLAPALGLASLTIIASVIGRVLPIGNTVIVPALIFCLLALALVREQKIVRSLQHALVVSGFGIVCGISVLAPLYIYGAFNAHNDAFTYLAHSHWLQTHAFADAIPSGDITPLNTQIVLYQRAGLRMGSSFLLAMFQTLLNLQWSFEAYPSVVIASLTSGCLAVGFPLMQVFRPIQRNMRIALLALPAFSLGGIVFAANLGFLPQTVGLALGSAFLFAAGPAFHWLCKTNVRQIQIVYLTVPSAILLSGAIFAYSEIAPFIGVAFVVSALYCAVQFRSWSKLLTFGSLLLVASVTLLNTELFRAYAAIRAQSNAVVGSPIEWSLLGFAAHAFGVHGGAWWDLFQWTRPENFGQSMFFFGLTLFLLLTGLIASRARALKEAIQCGMLLPIFVVLVVIGLSILYYRYVVPSPFPSGRGQSWSQFKLADWAHPFAMAIVLFCLASLRSRFNNLFPKAVAATFIASLIAAAALGVIRTKPLMNYYSGIKDLDQFYKTFRSTILDTCPHYAPIYLALGDQNQKFRQLALLYLFDQEVTSDWTDDGYLYPHLPPERRTQTVTVGNCVIEAQSQDGWLQEGVTAGPFRVGIFDGRSKVRIASVSGAYDRETDGPSWWHWVEHKIVFKVQPLSTEKSAAQTRVQFVYGTRSKQTLEFAITPRDGFSQKVTLQSEGETSAVVFDQVFNVPPAELSEISIQSNGVATPLGNNDARVAAWVIRNVHITAVSP